MHLILMREEFSDVHISHRLLFSVHSGGFILVLARLYVRAHVGYFLLFTLWRVGPVFSVCRLKNLKFSGEKRVEFLAALFTWLFSI